MSDLEKYTTGELEAEIRRRKNAEWEENQQKLRAATWEGPRGICSYNHHVGPIQQFTECCLNCQRNLYDTRP
jgi:hypothetical protein